MVLRSIVFTALLAALLTGCIGSPNPRNPMVQRKDPVKRAERRRLSTVRRPPRPPERNPVEPVLDRIPGNVWASHDRDLYSNVDNDSAKAAAPVYPWFKAKPEAKKSAD